jgi:hypothetical protein
MKKITKEQAAEILQQVQMSMACYPPPPQDEAFIDGYKVMKNQARKIIEGFTEKEFPTFTMSWEDSSDIENKVAIQLEDKEIVLKFDSSIDTFPYFSAEQFKEFVDGCNKIVGHLNGE